LGGGEGHRFAASFLTPAATAQRGSAGAAFSRTTVPDLDKLEPRTAKTAAIPDAHDMAILADAKEILEHLAGRLPSELEAVGQLCQPKESRLRELRGDVASVEVEAGF
jgi:hypothetical protein